jgi:hypothetical protein
MTKPTNFIAFVIAAALWGCAASPLREPAPPASGAQFAAPRLDTSLYSGGDGRSQVSAVIVGTKTNLGGIGKVYEWLRHYYPGYRLIRQAVTIPLDGKRFDIMTIRTKDGAEFDVWFDITAFYPVKEN